MDLEIKNQQNHSLQCATRNISSVKQRISYSEQWASFSASV